MQNRLANATSPYLLQHADNPVDWWPWGEAAFAEARRRDVPILLSVGYAACHWCHVMARESFADEETAAFLNANFVAVKVDREERPDVDAVYMETVQAATGQGGWPLTVFCTPQGEPFYFGTYFPPVPKRGGFPSFRQVLEGVTAAWRDSRADIDRSARRLVASLAETAPYSAKPAGEAELHAALERLSREYDSVHGGFGEAPKFPPPLIVEFLLRHHARTGSAAALRMAEHTCEQMARGGIYDQLGGGFARYAVDEEWGIPHFERMLYDNALLLRCYTHLWRANGSRLARQVALETADFLVRELRTPQGGFASALDADSKTADGWLTEGAYYVWTPEELREVLGPEDGALAAAYYGVTDRGTFQHGKSVLRAGYTATGTAHVPGANPRPPAPRTPGRPGPEVDPDRLAGIRRRLFEARAGRPRPARDESVVAAWNGLAVAALAEAGALFDRPDLVSVATAAADLLVCVHLDGARLVRNSRDGRPGGGTGVLEDYGDVAEGFLTLYAVTSDSEWLVFAGVLLDTVLARFRAGDGSFYDTADDAEPLIRRPRNPSDNATPSGWTAAAGALLAYSAYTGSSRHREAAEQALGVVRELAGRAPRFIGWGLAVAEAAVDGPREVAIVGPAGEEATAALHRTALLGTAPGAVVAVGEPDATSGTPVPLLQDRTTLDGRPAAYVCRGFRCQAPTADPAILAELVGVALRHPSH